MSLYDNFPEYFAKANVRAQDVHPAVVSADNVKFLREIALESYTASKVPISGLLSAENVHSRIEANTWPRATLDDREGKFLFRTLFDRNFNTLEIIRLLMEAYITQKQVNALFVGLEGFWRMVLTPIKSGINAIVDAEMMKVLSKVMVDLTRVSPTSENVTKVLRGMGYVHYIPFQERIEVVPPRYVPSIDVVAGILMVSSILAGMLFVYDSDGTVKINPEEPKHKADFDVPPERMFHPSPELGQAAWAALNPGLNETDMIRELGDVSVNAIGMPPPSFVFATRAEVANALRVLSRNSESPETRMILGREVVNLPSEIAPGDAIIVTPPTPGARQTFRPRTRYTFARAAEIDAVFQQGEVLLTAPLGGRTRVSPDDYLTVNGLPVVVPPTLDLSPAPGTAPTPRAAVYRTSLANPDPAPALPQFKLTSPLETGSIFSSPEWQLTVDSPGMLVRPITADDVFNSVPRFIAKGDAIIMTPPPEPDRQGDVQTPDVRRVLESDTRSKQRYPTFTFVRAAEIDSVFKEGDTLMIAPPPAPGTSGEPSTIRPDDLVTVDGMPLFAGADGRVMAELPRQPSSQVLDAIEVTPTRQGSLLKPIKFQRFALSEPGNVKSLTPVQLAAQDAHELSDADENQLLSWIDVVAKESTWDTYKATWSLADEAKTMLINQGHDAHQLYRLMPFIGPQLGSLRVDPLTPQAQLSIARDVEANGWLLGVATPTPQEKIMAATWVEHYYDAALDEPLRVELQEMIEGALLLRHIPGRIATDTVGIIKMVTNESARELYGNLAKIFVRGAAGLAGQLAQVPLDLLQRSTDYVAAKVQQEAHSVRRKMLEDEARQFATLPHDQLGPRLQEMLESADQHTGHEHTPDERALQVEGIVRDVVSHGIRNIPGYIADAVAFIGRAHTLGTLDTETWTEWNEDQQAENAVSKEVAAGIGQALESVGNGWESVQSGAQRLMSRLTEGEAYHIPTQSALQGITNSAAEEAPGPSSALLEGTFTSEDYALVRKLVNHARRMKLKTMHKRATEIEVNWYPLFYKYNDRLQQWKKIVEGAGGSQVHLPADALDNLKLALAMRATYETYVDELAADASAISKWTRSDEAQESVLDLQERVEEIFQFPKMVGLALDKLSTLPSEEREAFLTKAEAARIEMVKEDNAARRNKITGRYTDQYDLSRAVWLQVTQPPQVGPML